MSKANVDKHLRDVIKRATRARAALTLGLDISHNLDAIGSALQAATSENILNSLTDEEEQFQANIDANYRTR